MYHAHRTGARASGRGKSTLLNILGDLDTPTEGLVLCQGHDLTGADEDALAMVVLADRRNHFPASLLHAVVPGGAGHDALVARQPEDGHRHRAARHREPEAEGRTRLRDPDTISAPVAAMVRRICLAPGRGRPRTPVL